MCFWKLILSCVVTVAITTKYMHNHDMMILKIQICCRLLRASLCPSDTETQVHSMWNQLSTKCLSLIQTCALPQSCSSHRSPCPSLSPSLSLTFTQSLQSYWPWFLLICIHHFSFFGIWRWGTFPSLSEFTAISLCVFSKGLGYEMHIKYPLIPHYPTDKITMIMRQKF